MAKLLSGIVPALVTPFAEDGELAAERVPALVRHLLDAKVHGFFVCGGTGEGAALSVSERKEMGEAVIAETAGAVPVVLHVGGTATENAVDLARHAASVGADATASVAPVDAPGDLGAAAQHYGAIGAATDLPFYVYWVASSAGKGVTAEMFLEAMQPVRNFAGIKFTDKNFYTFQRLVDCSGGQLNAVTGPDEMCVAGMVMGSDGAIGSTYNIAPRLMVGMYEAFLAGRIADAMEAQVRLNRALAGLFDVGVLAGIKAMLGWRGILVGSPREPTPPLTPGGEARLRAALEELDFDLD